MRVSKRVSMLIAMLALTLSLAPASHAYSVLTHEAIIDYNWEESIKPLLLKKFPGASTERLREARAYAYGGCIIQDMGYYPFSSKFFSDLVHYVRSGDFIEAMVKEAQDINEYAFALGALAHYAADNNGHAVGTNRAVPLVYPELRARYGNEVTYEDAPTEHIKLEFGFDVLQVARGRYAPEAYHDFIGFEVSKPLLERAFKQTYGIEIKDIFANTDLAFGTYRRTVSSIIPEMTRVAWELKKDDIEKNSPGITRDKFVYSLSRMSYEKEWGNKYEKPGFFAKSMAFFFRIVPKVGPFKALAFKAPTPEAERLFITSFDATIERYYALLKDVRAGQLRLSNRNIDTGRETRAGEYRLADKTYAKLLEKLEDHNFENITPPLRENILAFYSNLSAPIATKQDKGDWRKTLRAIDRLKTTQAAQTGNR